MPSGTRAVGSASSRRVRVPDAASSRYAVAGAVTLRFVLLRPQADLTVVVMDAPEAIVAGEPFEVSVDVRNTGDAEGAREFTLLVDGVPAATSSIELEASSDGVVEFDLARLPAGTHELSVDGFADVHQSLWVMTPARLVVDELTATPEQVDLAVDPVVDVHVRYTNVGEAVATDALEVTVDGRPVEPLDVDLAGGESGEATVALTMDTPGHPVIGVGDATVEIWVLAPAEFVIDELVVTPVQHV